MDVFISYSSKDRAWVRGELLKRIEQAGLKAFIDFRDFTRGAPSIKECERGVVACRKTLLILTPDYIASGWGEIENIMLQALDPTNRELRLIPLLKAECQKPLRIGALTHIDFTDGADHDLAWRQLLTALGKPPEPEPEPEPPQTPPPVPRRPIKRIVGAVVLLLVVLLLTALLIYGLRPTNGPLEQFDLESDVAKPVANHFLETNKLKHLQLLKKQQARFSFVLNTDVEPGTYFRQDYEDIAGKDNRRVDVYFEINGRFDKQKFTDDPVILVGTITKVEKATLEEIRIVIDGARFIEQPGNP